MQKTAVKTVPIESIPAVVEFVNARDAIQEFKEEHAEVFEQLEQLTEQYNTTLEQAVQSCRAQKVGCGPIVLKHFATKYDAEALYNAVGRDKFLELGGKLATQTVYDLDKGRLEACIAQNKLPKDVVETVRKESANFSKPEPLVVP